MTPHAVSGDDYILKVLSYIIGMVAALDESVLNISIALSDKGFMKNTIIIFTTNSGGAVGGMNLNSASNFPLRGSKMTVWEGGIRGVAFVYSDMITDNCKYLLPSSLILSQKK